MWVPFPSKGGNKIWIVAGVIVWLVIIVFLKKHRIWLFYFIWGAVGFTVLLIMTIKDSPMEYFMEHQSGLILQFILRLLNIVSLVYNDAPGTLLVLSRIDNTWTTMGVDIETSGLLEMCIFLGLIFFYPGYSTKMRIGYSWLGVILVYLINLVRMLTVISIVQVGGRDYLFFAHSVLGRLVYFVLTIALYWVVFTKPTLKIIWEQVENA
ncbi:MAG: exosortase family protein XrtG [Desulfitobacteriaceae bacterium]